MAEPRNDPYPDVFIGGGFFDAEAHTDAEAGTGTGRSGRATGAGCGTVPRIGRDAWRRGPVLAACAMLAVVLLAFHAVVPNSAGNMGSLLETVLPWVGLAVPVLLPAALIRRSATALAAVVILAVTWIALFGGMFIGSASAAEPNLTVVTHNVGASNPDPTSTAYDLLAADPDLVALEEVTDAALPSYRKVLDRRLTHSVHIGTVALWSRYPITESRRVTIDPGWSRSLRAEVRGPRGPLAVYVVHLPSVRVGASGFTAGRRDQVVAALDEEIDKEPQKEVVLLGDLNGTTDDRSLAPVRARLKSVQDAAGAGFGFTWPSTFPFARVDQILTRGVAPTDAWTLPRTGSDHLPIAAKLRV